MDTVGIRALKQNASAVVAATTEGRAVTITDRGRPVAQLSPIPRSPIDRLRSSGRLRAPRNPKTALDLGPLGDLTTALRELRDDERY